MSAHVRADVGVLVALMLGCTSGGGTAAAPPRAAPEPVPTVTEAAPGAALRTGAPREADVGCNFTAATPGDGAYVGVAELSVTRKEPEAREVVGGFRVVLFSSWSSEPLSNFQPGATIPEQAVPLGSGDFLRLVRVEIGDEATGGSIYVVDVIPPGGRPPDRISSSHGFTGLARAFLPDGSQSLSFWCTGSEDRLDR